jgi:hypothetical protein
MEATAMIGTACSGPNTKTSTGSRMIDEPVPITPPIVPANTPTISTKA